MSWAPQVIVDSSGEWCSNALRFATRAEAEANARDLACRWLLVKQWRVVESSDPVNCAWCGGLLWPQEGSDVQADGH